MSDFQSQLDRLYRRILMMVTPVQITTTNDTGNVLTAQIGVSNTPEIIDSVPLLQYYGFHANPPPKTDAIAIFGGGERSNAVLVGTNSTQSRPRNYKAGEIGLFTAEGDTLKFAEKQAVTLTAGNSFTANTKTATIKGTTGVTLDTPNTHHTGDVKSDGKVDANGGFWKNGVEMGTGGGGGGTAGPPGPQGPPGATGPAGEDGNTVLHGTGAPPTATGVDGDFYIDTAPHNIYGPKAGSWPTPGTSLIGPQGATGSPGVGGPAGPSGSTGAQGPKGDTGTAGAQGPTGATGSQGVPGPTGPTGATGATGAANMSGMVAGQIPIAASATAVTSSIPTSTFLTPAAAASTYLSLAGGTLSGDLTIGGSLSTVGSDVEIGAGRAADGFATVDLHATAGAGDYDLRVARGAGVNGSAVLQNAGTGSFQVNTSAGVQVQGTPSNDNAPAGYVGEYISTLNTGGTVFSAATNTTIATINLTPGDWDLSANIAINWTGSANELYAGLNAANTMPGTGISDSAALAHIALSTATMTGNLNLGVGSCRASAAGVFSYYVVIWAGGSGGTAYCKISARRAR